MEFVKQSSEKEMISEFLKAEIDSEQFKQGVFDALKKYNASEKIIKFPNLNNQEENEIRKLILGKCRGYGMNEHLFENFPPNVRWGKFYLSIEKLKNIKYINWSYWLELSNGSRLAVEAVKNIKKGIKVFNESNEPFFKIAKDFKNGKKFSPLILVSADHNKTLIILEGHKRLTAYMLEPTFLPEKMEVIIGNSSDFIKWDLY